MAYEAVIGLEIHVELHTASKIFCGCSTAFGAPPNTQTCPICTGMPGTLPVLNEQVAQLAVKAGLALQCDIQMVNKMDRKNYFYPDLPKAYQISQYDLPICTDGHLEIEVEGETKRVGITRIHIEEDPGKLIHTDDGTTLIDYNRSGVPLIEIVTEPDIRSEAEAMAFLKGLKAILQYADISDCRMEQGSLRCDANISVREVGETQLNTKVEIKNLNSFKEVSKALAKEYKRQSELYRFGEGQKIRQETRKWDAAKGRTLTMRTKEDAHDYRYFPEPDLPPILLEDETLVRLQENMPELPEEKRVWLMEAYGLSDQEAMVLTSEKVVAQFFEAVIDLGAQPKRAANWVMTEVLRSMKDSDEIPVQPKQLADILHMIEAHTISTTAAKDVFEAILGTDKCAMELVEERGLAQIHNEDELSDVIEEVFAAHSKAVEDFMSGKPEAAGFLMGMVMKATKGQANPALTRAMIDEKLKAMQ